MCARPVLGVGLVVATRLWPCFPRVQDLEGNTHRTVNRIMNSGKRERCSGGNKQEMKTALGWRGQGGLPEELPLTSG